MAKKNTLKTESQQDLKAQNTTASLIDSIYDYPERFLSFAKLHPEIYDTNGDMVYMAQKLVDDGYRDKDLQFKDVENEKDSHSVFYEFRTFLNNVLLKNKKGKYVDIYQKRNYSAVKQSMQLTKVRYDFTPCEKNIFLKVVEICQQFFYEDVVIDNCSIKMEDFHVGGIVPVVRFPIKEILPDNNTNYTWVKQGLSALNSKQFQLPDENWDFVETHLFQRVMSSSRGEIGVILTIDFWNAFRDMECYKVINTKLAMSFKSIYTERIYELLVGNKVPITYNIDNLKRMFCLEEKYKNNGDFIKWVVEKAKKEIDDCKECPFIFTYDLIKVGRKFDSVKFIVYPRVEPADDSAEDSEREKFIKDITLSDKVIDAVKQYYPTVKVNRADVIAKLKWAQGNLGVNETVEMVKKLRETAVELFTKGKIKTSIDAFFLGSLMRSVQEHIETEKQKHIDHTPAKPKDDNEYPFTRVNIGKDEELNSFGEDDKYVYYTDKFIRHAAKMANLTVDEYIKKWNYELFAKNLWRVTKDA